jgi:putative cardiolipin synthase
MNRVICVPGLQGRVNRPLLCTLALILSLGVVACSTVVVAPYEPPAAEYALAPGPKGPFTELENYFHASYGANMSAFRLLDSNEDALRWRLALIDSARYAIDLQYYLWYGDLAGQLLASRILDAADRGVKVRLMVDDLNTLLRNASSVLLRDEVVAWLDSHPNVELRLFNPWSERDFGGRIGEGMANFERTNVRMHNKSLIVDNRAVIIGGRNIGDEYMGLNSSFNFHDLDVLGIGPVARQASDSFDAYWNSSWVMPASALNIETKPGASDRLRAELSQHLAASLALSRFAIDSRSWDSEIADLRGTMHAGTSRVVSDLPREGRIDRVMLDEIQSLISSPQQELMIVNAYIIPADRGIATLKQLNAGGRGVKIMTNSLASHDVPAVNSHYRPWRKPILESGAELYELRADAALKEQVCDTAPTVSEFVGLHSKAMVVDRQVSFIGSMNFDPRSAALNTEMGVIIRSAGMGQALAELFERNMSVANSWQVTLDEDGNMQWAHDTEVVDMQPARNFWQRIQELFFRAMPKEYY